MIYQENYIDNFDTFEEFHKSIPIIIFNHIIIRGGFMFDNKILLLTTLIYGIVETLEKFGLKKQLAHPIAIPLGIIGSFFILPSTSLYEHIINGIYAGLMSVGTCDTLCNVVDRVKEKNISKMKS